MNCKEVEARGKWRKPSQVKGSKGDEVATSSNSTRRMDDFGEHQDGANSAIFNAVPFKS